VFFFRHHIDLYLQILFLRFIRKTNKLFMFMRRILFSILFSILCFACSKQENKETTENSMPNSAQIISGSSGAKAVVYGVTVRIGHSGTNCPGCVTSGGAHTHVDCQGPGNACQVKSAMKISASGEVTYYYGIVLDPDELTDDDSFLMPDRSLYIIGSNGEFLNIPEQVAYRDEETGTFIFHDIFFSDFQAFNNN
jgi:hypothetical protein